MSVRLYIPEKEGTYFVSFTCNKWLPLFSMTECYDTIYKWFNNLKNKGHYINGYVIMPNHLHLLLSIKFQKKVLQQSLVMESDSLHMK
jgi:REP element-mobilizing transposase RayT